MRYLMAVILVLLFATPVFATDLVCDPQAGVTSYKITGDAWWTGPVAAQADGSIKTSVTNISSGTHSINVAACKTDAVWGEVCSATAPFTFTKPAAPTVPSGLKLLP